MHLTSSPIDWYAARGAGVVAYALLTVTVALGLALSGGRASERWPRFALEELHRSAGLLVGAFLTIHVVTVAVDAYLRFSLVAILVPFAGSYRPVWVGLGVVAAELLLALAVVNRLRDRIGHRRWRLLHYASFAVWGAASVHGVATGTDRNAWWLVALEGVSVGAVAWLAWARLGLGQPALAGLAGAAAVVALALFVFPFHPRAWNALRFHDRLHAVVSRDAGPTRELVSLTASGDGEQRVLLRADLLVEPRGPLATSFQLEFLPSGMRCTGRVLRLAGSGFDGRCRAADGSVRTVRARFDGLTGGVSQGTLDVHA